MMTNKGNTGSKPETYKTNALGKHQGDAWGLLENTPLIVI